MGKAVYFFAGPQDSAAIARFANSIGLQLVSPLANEPEISPEEDPRLGPFVYLTPLQKGEMHPYGYPPKIGPATDPLLEFWRSYFTPTPPVLVMGRLFCSDDVPKYFDITRPYFSKLTKWMRGAWKKLPEGQFIGPDAQKLAECGAELAYFSPGVPVDIKPV